MAKVLEYESGAASVQIVVDESLPAGPSQKAGTGSAMLPGGKAAVSLEAATQVVGTLADAFSVALENCPNKPSLVEVTFGLEAGGEIGNFLISKITGKTNFSVKLSWKYE